MNHSAAYYLYNIATNSNNLYNKAVDIYNALNYSGHTIAYWVNAIDTWMSPLYTAVTSVPTDLSIIQGLLGYPSNDGGGTTWHPYLQEIKESITNVGSSNWNMYSNSHGQLFEGTPSSFPSDWYYIGEVLSNGVSNQNPKGWNYGTPLGNIALLLQFLNKNIANSYSYRWSADLTGYNSLQSLVSFEDPDSTVTFTPSSATDGIYKYLNAINTPVARLGYVLASDSRIEAQDAAAANEQAVVDNFIDSTGNGSASPSDIGSISDLSSGYKSNFGSDASVSGIFNIFNSNNMGWFSQETANQLDTTTNTRRGSLFNTPLLDQQINNIYDQIGVIHD